MSVLPDLLSSANFLGKLFLVVVYEKAGPVHNCVPWLLHPSSIRNDLRKINRILKARVASFSPAMCSRNISLCCILGLVVLRLRVPFLGYSLFTFTLANRARFPGSLSFSFPCSEFISPSVYSPFPRRIGILPFLPKPHVALPQGAIYLVQSWLNNFCYFLSRGGNATNNLQNTL